MRKKGEREGGRRLMRPERGEEWRRGGGEEGGLLW